MKIYVFLLMLLVSIPVLRGQDIITKTNGDEIQAKVLNINKESISYKKWSNLEGPTYTILVSEVFMIKYENGEKELFKSESTQKQESSIQQTNPNRYSNVGLDSYSLAKYQEKEDLLRRASVNKTWGTVCIVAGAATAIAGGVLAVCDVIPLNGAAEWAMIGGGVGICCIGGGALHGIASRLRSEANAIHIASIYEQQFQIVNGYALSPSLKLISQKDTNTSRSYSLGVGLTLKF